jgi:MerR family glutamine synthetase transcriptional repressor
MAEKELRRNMAVLPIGTIRELTDLSDRQIRYYEEQGLITPERTDSNRRMFSLNDIDRLLEIKDYLDAGDTIADIQAIYNKQAVKKRQQQAPDLSAHEMRKALQSEFMNIAGFSVNKNRKGY